MTPERWEQVGQLYHAALELAPGERAAFLHGACAGDEALRREVESLIAADEQAGGFIAAPALKDAMEMVTVETVEMTGQPAKKAVRERIGHYQIKSLLGAGGMGEVYLAQDTRLGRQVAIKLLPPEAAQSQTAKRRLLREARAAAALNHPNIVTIHSIEEADDSVFIVMEYVEGETLTAKIRGEKLEFPRLLDAGAQIADALAAAHSVGLVHRDIKPSNILITREGQVKLLDFGIAKVARPFHTEGGGTDSRLTAEGDIIGTVAYMSPEQGRGEKLDARTDIFSLGGVLYEAATGKLPFSGPNSLAILRQIDGAEPPPPSAIKPGLPPEFDLIIERALAKDKERRYQSASELAAALRRLKGKAAGVFSSAEEETPEPAEAQRAGKDQLDAGATMADSASLGQKSDPGVAQFSSVILLRRKTAIAAAAGAVVALAVLAFAAYKLFERTRPGDGETLAAVETKLTNTGNISASRPAISPDGKYVAYAVLDSQQTSSLWVRQIAAFSSAQLIPPARVAYGGMTFSRDGNHIYYLMREEKAQVMSLYRIPLLGGAPKKVIEDVGSPVSFSPDGSRFVFRRSSRVWRGGALFVANADGGGEQRIATVKPPEFFEDPSWSPDGRVIACSAGHADGGVNRYVVEVSVGDWKMRPISAKKWRWIGPVEWLPDGKGLLMIASDNAAEPYRVWRLSYPGGEARRITNNAVNFTRLSLTADSSALLTLQIKRNTNLWMVPVEDPRLARKMTFGAGGFRSQLRWTPGGKIVFDSETAGAFDISVMDEDGSGQRQLLGDLASQSVAVSSAVSPDGRQVVFGFDQAGVRNIWRMDINGGNLIRLTSGRGEDNPHCSPDGRWVVYTDIGSDRQTLWKVSIDGGEPAQLTGTFSRVPSVSPDGKLIACFYSNEESGVRWRLALLPFDGGEPVKIFPQPVYSAYPAKWTPDGRALTYMDGGQSNIWLQPVAGGAPKKLTDFTNDLIFGYEWSPDGKRLACVRGIWERDLILVNNFR
jgi:serine/threonine protein kinase/Tol biopolymer transport system component